MQKNLPEWVVKVSWMDTKLGAEAWISYNFDRASKELSIDSTVKLSLLLEEGAELADCRVSIKRGSTNRTDVNQLLRMSRRDSTGAVTPTLSNTL